MDQKHLQGGPLHWAVYRRLRIAARGSFYELCARFRYRSHAELYVRGLTAISDDAPLRHEIVCEEPTYENSAH